MQWTVRYFCYRSQSWRLPEDTRTESICSSSGTSTGMFRDTGMDTGISTTKTLDPKLTTGTIAYQRRNHAIWEELMNKADCMFARLNDAYQSPL